MRQALAPILALLAMVVVLGAGHGVWTDRWAHSEELVQSLARLEKVPSNCGDWKGENLEYDPEVMESAGIKGCVFRKYRNSRSGAELSVLVVCGRGGPISVHTPDVCYSAAGFQQSAGQVRTDIGLQNGDFWKGFFVLSNSIVPRRLEIMWAWSRDGNIWSAPDSPRYQFARHAAVYKIYVVRDSPVPFRDDDVTLQEFLAQFLPDVRRSFETAP